MQPKRGSTPPKKVDTKAIERELDSLGYTTPLKTQAQRLDESRWNLEGYEPSPTYFSDLGDPSDFWSAALKDPRLARYALPTPIRTKLSVGSLVRTAHGLEAEIQIHHRGPPTSLRVQVPADAGLRQLLHEPRTNRPPVLPFPLAVLTREGTDLQLVAIGQGLEAVADALGVRKTLPLWNPDTQTYDLIGTARLVSLTVVGVEISVYGEIHVRYLPDYEISRLRATAGAYSGLTPRDERPLTTTLELDALLAAPAFFAPLKALVARALAG
jgi:hypothetical protein